MEIKGKVHCFFEQSGTFKNEFKKLGYEAYDYDIQNNFGETDYLIDLFSEIENAYDDKTSIFDDITSDDLILAFFPCIYFEAMQANYYRVVGCNNLSSLHAKEKYYTVIERIKNREQYYILLYKLFCICEVKCLILILENPATQPHYLLHPANFIPYTFIDKDRTRRGDYFKKPTAYWFFNCKPTYGCSFQNDKEQKIVSKCKSGIKAGICSEERSMISPDYARNFICDFIIGKKQNISQLTLF